MSGRFWGVIALIVVVFGGIIVFSNHNKQNNGTASPSNHIMGTAKNNVTLLEYGDYECPACGEYYPTVKQVVAQYQDRIQFQFRNLPLNQVHPNAYAGARAAEAASLQNKFWQMHDLLYENQSAWTQQSNPEPFFEQYARQLGLNLTKFKADFSSDQINNTIIADLNAFNKTGAVTATPTFFLNGKQVKPAASVAEFQKLLDQALASSPNK